MINKLLCCFRHLNLYKNKNRVEKTENLFDNDYLQLKIDLQIT